MGMYLYDQNGKQLGKGSGGYYYRIYFKINEELGVTLVPGTTYKYKFYAIVDGKTYWGEEGSFKTAGTAPVANYSIILDHTSLSLTEGESRTISATVSPSDAAVVWSSSNPSVATVSSGKVTAVKAGTATITVRSAGMAPVSIKIEVK